MYNSDEKQVFSFFGSNKTRKRVSFPIHQILLEYFKEFKISIMYSDPLKK